MGYEFVFADDKKAGWNLKILEMAAKWKRQQAEAQKRQADDISS